MAISQNIGTTITALLPALFATVAPPGSTNIPLTIGAIAFGDHGHRGARGLECARDLPRPPERPRRAERGAGRKPEYDRMRAQAVAEAALAKS